jgi:hypothetical protein
VICVLQVCHAVGEFLDGEQELIAFEIQVFGRERGAVGEVYLRLVDVRGTLEANHSPHTGGGEDGCDVVGEEGEGGEDVVDVELDVILLDVAEGDCELLDVTVAGVRGF